MKTAAAATALEQAFAGALLADSLSMPVHWYYDREALDRDYGPVNRLMAPRNPHPDSILWRSHYAPAGPDADILHDQAAYWGQRGVHYHQFLAAGENTLNYQLSRALHDWVIGQGGYDPDGWLDYYVSLMRTPGWHKDTYVEEVHRGFFANRAAGKPLRACAVKDLHIGALAQIPALLAALAVTLPDRPDLWAELTLTHVSLTHAHPYALSAAHILTQLLLAMSGTEISLEAALEQVASEVVSLRQFRKWRELPDREVIGRTLTPACYLPESLTAALYLVWKYERDPRAGLQANAEVGGDNCHRGAVVGSLLCCRQPPPFFSVA